MISIEDVRKLLETEDSDAVLVFIEGRAEVINEGDLDSDQYRGALRVIDRSDLVDRLSAEPSEHELAEQAGQLDSQISEMGG
jgi:hypothetical protein